MHTTRVRALIWGTVAVVLIVLALGFLLGPFTSWIAGPEVGGLDARERLPLLSGVRAHVTAAISGLGIGIPLYLTAKKFILERDKQVTDRFNAAIDHLGHDSETVRAGGVRALQRILEDSPRDRDRVLQSLTGFLRRQPRSGSHRSAPDDVDAALAAIRHPRRPRKNDPELALDLRGCDLPGANLRAAFLAEADLSSAILTDATLARTDLSGARLDRALLSGSDLTGANLTSADLTHADLHDTDLTGSDLSRGNLRDADLTGATVNAATFSGAELAGADLTNTDLTRAVGITGEQLAQARGDNRTLLPSGLSVPQEWTA